MRGVYQTRQQEAVAALFQRQAERCLTAEEAYRALAEAGIGKTTVYRAIARLCEGGALRRYTAHESGEAAMYQWNPCGGSHMHIRCVSCGTLCHLHCDEVESFKAHLNLHHGFTLDEGQTVLYGQCDACRRQQHEE